MTIRSAAIGRFRTKVQIQYKRRFFDSILQSNSIARQKAICHVAPWPCHQVGHNAHRTELASIGLKIRPLR